MKKAISRFYNSMPYPFKVIAASAWGHYLRWWRYGPETEKLVQEALERETWSPERWKSWQEEKLALVLHRAAIKVPYYRDQWSQRRQHGDNSSWEYLENWPLLEKETLRSFPKAFVADDCKIQRMYLQHTSGTTGKPLDLWFSRKALQSFYALFEARWRRWYGVSRNDNWAILGGQLVTPFEQRKPPFWVWNNVLNQLYMSAYHTAPDLIPFYLEALKHYHIKFLFGYSSALFALAHEILRSRLPKMAMSVVITNAEPLFDYQRQAISEAFSCPVHETYGMCEFVIGASECNAGHLHLWPELGVTEVFVDGIPSPRGNSGDLICTGFLNIDMPLIRYRVLDRGALPPVDYGCSCKRSLPILASLDGRVGDCLYTADGRIIGLPDIIFDSETRIREGQIIQEGLDLVKVRFVPSEDFSDDSARLIVKRLQERMGAINVILEPVNHIPRDANGKFRIVVCELPTNVINDINKSIISSN